MSTFTVGSATAEVIRDSSYWVSRLVSLVVTFPRPFLAEFNTHCRFSRNSASSRAIPVWRRLATILEEPYVPNSFGTNKSGMQAGEDLSSEDRESMRKNWLFGRDIALVQAYYLTGGRREMLRSTRGEVEQELKEELCDQIETLARDYGIEEFLRTQNQGLHKQHANRVLEPYSFHTVIVTATHWRNFFGLRASALAQPEAQDFALAMAKAMQASKPIELSGGDWHLPYISKEDFTERVNNHDLALASAGRCARVSYLTHDGRRSLEEDLKLARNLHKNGHMSPFQHPARAGHQRNGRNHGNYSSVWVQLRKIHENESDFTRLVSRDDLVVGCRGDEELADFILSLPE